MTDPVENSGRAEFAQAAREHATAQREAAELFTQLSAARSRRATLAPAATASADTEIAALQRRLEQTNQTLAALTQRMSDARARALGDATGFEQLSPALPLLMLPVRLETRFAWLKKGVVTFDPDPTFEQVLLVRIYPDEIHEDSHEPELTAQELGWLKEFRQKLLAARDVQPIRDAWAQLIGRAGATRASYLGQVAISAHIPGMRPAVFSRPAQAQLLPDRWVAFATLPDGSTLTATSAPLRQPLETGPSPSGMDWMINFAVAQKAGMALIVGPIPTDVTEITRLIVVGARGTLDPGQSQSALQDLFDAHHYTSGLSLLAPGTATNCNPETRAGFTSRPAVTDVVAIEERRYRVGGGSSPLCHRGDLSDGTALANALGIDPAVFAYVSHADGTDQFDGMLMRSVLVAATRRILGRMLEHILDPTTCDTLLNFAVERVSALGPLPTLRVGRQPYAVLPVMLTEGVNFPAGSGAASFLPALRALRAVWQQATDHLPWIGQTGADPGTTLVKILQRDGVASRLALRPLLGPQIGAIVAAATTGRSATILNAQRHRAATEIDALGARQSAASPLLQTMHLTIAPALSQPVVEPVDVASSSAQRAANYLETIASLRPDLLLQNNYGTADRPRPLLFAIARLAMLELADARAREVLIAAGSNPAHWDDEEVPTVFVSALASPLRRLQAPDPADPIETIAFHLSEQGRDAAVLNGMRDTLRTLKTRNPDALELQLRACLGLFSHRLDAWYTALAMQRLLEVRNSSASTQSGINIAAYGVLDSIKRSPRQKVAGSPNLYSDPTNGGYIHAPSVNHGAAAAVIRSVHLAHSAAGHGEAFSVDLSSERVRTALDLLDGVRQGQPLAALLGYRLERQLAVEQLQSYIASFRVIAPLLANTLTPSNSPADTVAANNVVDGLKLLSEAGYDGEQSASVDTLFQRHASLGAVPSGNALDAMKRVLAAAEDAIDAVSDLVLAEGVYQSVQGNPARSGASADSISGAPVPPVEMKVIKTPRSGVAATHRLLVLLGSQNGTGGWATTSRATFEPRLEALCASVLPDPAHIRLRARFTDRTGEVIAALDDLTLDDLLQAATDEPHSHLLMGAYDAVALADPQQSVQRAAIEVRLAALFELQRPAAAANAALQLLLDRDPNWDPTDFSFAETLEIAAQLRNSIGHARALAPADLAPPGLTPTLALNATEYANRAQGAADLLAQLTSSLQTLATGSDAVELRKTLFLLDSLGVAGAAPLSLRDSDNAKTQAALLAQLQTQATAVLTELTRRAQQLTAATDSSASLQAVFGPGFVSLPLFQSAASVTSLFAAPPSGADNAATWSWFSRVSRVREGARLLDATLSGADVVAQALNRATQPRLNVAQLGSAPGEDWICLPLQAGATLPGGRTSIVAVTPGAMPANDIAGLFVDEWVEVVPNNAETTSVAFHYESPSSAPAQAILLGVPTPGLQSWTAPLAQQLITESLSLAKLRLVDMDDLSALGQLLPGFVTAENTAGEIAALDIEFLTRPGVR
jgi:hypothetical protein